MLQLTYWVLDILDIEYWYFLDIGNDICEADAPISVRSTKSPPSPPSPPALHQVSTWFPPGLHRVSTGSPLGLHWVFIGSPLGLHRVSTKLHQVSTGSPPGHRCSTMPLLTNGILEGIGGTGPCTNLTKYLKTKCDAFFTRFSCIIVGSGLIIFLI